MGWKDVLRPPSEAEIAKGMEIQKLIIQIERSSLENNIDELNRLFDLARDKVDMAYFEPRVFKIIIHDYVEQFELFQKEGVVNNENYLKYLNFAGGHSSGITKLLLEYPINDPVNLFLTIKKAIQFARRKDNQQAVDMLEQYLKDHN